MAVVDLFSWVLLALGGTLVFIGGLGLLRFPDFFTRLHAAGVTDTLGAWAILAGLMLQAGITLITVKLIAIWIFLLITSPTSSHALAKAALHGGVVPLGDSSKDNPGGSAD